MGVIQTFIIAKMKSKFNLFWNWLNYSLSYWTHNNKPKYQYDLWCRYQDSKLISEKSKLVNYTHTVKQSELNGKS